MAGSFDTKGCVQKFPRKEQPSILPQCKFLNPFILEGDDIVILWFLFLKGSGSQSVVMPGLGTSQHHLRACYKCRLLGPASGVQHRKPWGRALGICVSTDPPGDSGVHLGMRTTGSVRSVWECLYSSNKNHLLGDFPAGPVVKTPLFQCKGCGFDPWSGN